MPTSLESSRPIMAPSARASVRYSTYSMNAPSVVSTDSISAEIRPIVDGLERLKNPRLADQRVLLSEEKSTNLAKLALSAKLERALDRRMTSQDAVMRPRKPTRCERRDEGARSYPPPTSCSPQNAQQRAGPHRSVGTAAARTTTFPAPAVATVSVWNLMRQDMQARLNAGDYGRHLHLFFFCFQFGKSSRRELFFSWGRRERERARERREHEWVHLGGEIWVVLGGSRKTAEWHLQDQRLGNIRATARSGF
ncbi:hypothetical protein VTH06DRAFT_6724 [Thermothelomyces fergusii]